MDCGPYFSQCECLAAVPAFLEGKGGWEKDLQVVQRSKLTLNKVSRIQCPTTPVQSTLPKVSRLASKCKAAKPITPVRNLELLSPSMVATGTVFDPKAIKGL